MFRKHCLGFSLVLLHWENLSNTLSTWSGATLLLMLGTIFKLHGFKLIDLFHSLRRLSYMFSTILYGIILLRYIHIHVFYYTQLVLMRSLSLWSWLARMWRSILTWLSSSPWTLAMLGGQTYPTTSSNSSGGKSIICMYTHVCCMHVPCACNVIGMMIVCVMMMEIWHSVMSLISSHNYLTGSNNCCMLWNWPIPFVYD